MTHRRLLGVILIAGITLWWGGPIGWGQEEAEGPLEDVRAVASRGTLPRVVQTATGTISMDLVDATLEDVLKLLSQQAGLNFVAAQAVRDKRVTVYMDRVPIPAAIRSLLDANNLAFVASDANVFIVTESGDRPVRLITRVYTLRFARVLPTVGEAVSSFGTTGSLVQTALGESSSEGGEGGGGGSTGGGGLSNLAGTQGTATQGIVAIIKQLLTERGAVTIDPRTNSLAVTDVPSSFPTVEEAIAKLDVKPSQVYLEAEVLEVSTNTLRRLGIEYGTSTGTIATYTGPARQSTFPFTKELLKDPDKSATKNTLGELSLLPSAAVVFKALTTEKDVKYLARPRLMTLSNEVAEIQIVTETATGTVTTSQATTGTTTSEAERRSVGTILRVTPLVTADRYITMVIEPEVSRITESSKFSNFLDPARRAARTTVMVESGETVMIAGLLSGEWEGSERKIPILGDIPLLGLPFRRSEKSRVDTEIVIFITPRILPDRPAGATVTATVPLREQSPLSTQEETAYRRYRQELIRQQRIKDTMDMLHV